MLPGKLLPLALLLSASFLAAFAGEPAPGPAPGHYFIATDGDDTWSGTLPEANAEKSDGPFGSLGAARDALRRERAGGEPAGEVTVWVRGGVYPVRETVRFTPEDSGSEGRTVTYAAYPGERPVLSGGQAIRGWTKGEGEIWQAKVESGWTFHQLFVNGRRRTRARTPNEGYLYTAGILAPFDRAKWYAADIEAKRGFVFRNGDLRRWTNFDDAMVVIYHSWTTSLHFITELDDREKTVRLAPPSSWPIGYWWEYNTRYHVENVREALDRPGEWYLDRAAGVLHYWPMPGEAMESAEAIAPVAGPTLLSFEGRPAEKSYVEHLRFRGLVWQHADCALSPDMPTDQQGATERRPAVAAVGLKNAAFEDCEIAHVGENGLWLDAGCSGVAVRRCHIHDLGASGVFIGPKNYDGTPETAVERNVLDNNWIHDGSHVFRGSQGVWIGKASHNEVTHNEISDFHHIGISVGHAWGYAPTTAHHNLVAFNRVHHICNGYFSDGGGIYTLGVSPGTAIRGNVVHDVTPTPLMPVGGCGIYHDEGSTGIVVENNVVYRVGAAAYHQHYGRENLARNNIFALAGRDPVTCARAEEHLSYRFEGNIVLSDSGQVISDHYSPLQCKTEFERNLYWDLSGKEPLFAGKAFAEWQAAGRDRASRIADPRFRDPRAGDFRLEADSPALAMGFQPIDADQAGLYGDADWVAGPAKVVRPPIPQLPPPPPPPPPRPLRER